MLAWIVYSKRAFLTEELQHALAVRPHTTNLDKNFLPTVKFLQSLCAGFLRSTKKAALSRKFVAYLSFQVFKGGRCKYDALKERLRSHRFYNYAAHNWGHHARDCSASFDKVIPFLEDTAKVKAANQALLVYSKYYYNIQAVPRGVFRCRNRHKATPRHEDCQCWLKG